MSFKEIPVEYLNENFINLIGKEWMLISAGGSDGYNMMTASWGFAGEMWGAHCAVVCIRPQRYTYEFVEREDCFALSFYGDNKDIHKICGNRSGRDIDKAAESGLTPVFSDDTVYFEQARLVLICKKLYAQDLSPDNFVDKSLVGRWYGANDFHRMYTGEIIKALVKE